MAGNFGLWRSIWVYVWCMEKYGRRFCLWRSFRVYVWCIEVYGRQFCVWRSSRQVWWSSLLSIWCMKICGRQFWSTEVQPGVCLVDGNNWSAVLVYGGQFGFMFGAWKNMVGSFGLSMSIRVYVWCMELYGRQFCLWRSTRVYVWCME